MHHNYNSITEKISEVHVLVEVFGGKFLVQKGHDDKWKSGAWIASKDITDLQDAAAKAIKLDLGINISSAKDLQKVTSFNSKSHYIVVFTYLLDLNDETLELNQEKIKEIKITNLSDIINDIQDNKDNYDSTFVQIFNIFLTLEKQ